MMYARLNGFAQQLPSAQKVTNSAQEITDVITLLEFISTPHLFRPKVPSWLILLFKKFVNGCRAHYPDPRRDEWQTKVLPILKKIPIAALMRVSGRSRSMLARTLAGRSRPRKRNQELLKSMLHKLGVVN